MAGKNRFKNWLLDTIKTMFLLELIGGLRLTLAHMFKKPITMRYPEEEWVMSERFRGQQVLVRAPEAPDEDLCVACCLCARVCPSGAITIITSLGEDNQKRIDDYRIDLTRCIFCGFCVEVCPVAALNSSHNYHLATVDKTTLLFNKQSLLEEGKKWRQYQLKAKEKGWQPQTVIKKR